MYKTLVGSKPLRIMFYKMDGFVRDYNETKYLVLFGSEKYDAIFNRIRYLVTLKCSISYVFSHDNAKIKNNSDDDLSEEKNIDFVSFL